LDTRVVAEIEKLRRASLAALRAKHREIFGEEPRSRHREHVFRRVAWRLQALAEGGLSERAHQRARAIACETDLRVVAPSEFLLIGDQQIRTLHGRERRERDTRLPLPGAVLTRHWKGRAIVVEVLAEGFRYEGRRFSSLSAIASEVTGTRWNGLAFFGLVRPVTEKPDAKK
jgi:hypothetical protein